MYVCVWWGGGGELWGPLAELVTLGTQRTEGRYSATGSVVAGVGDELSERGCDPMNFRDPRGHTGVPETR